MGIDICHQAVPGDWPLLDLARSDQQAADLLQMTHAALCGRIPRRPAYLAFIAESERLRRERPGIERRFHAPVERAWDLLHYVLSPGRRRLPFTPWTDLPADLGTIAARGAAEVGPLALGGQGFPTRLSSPSQVGEAASFLMKVTEDELRALFEPAEIQKHGVYKFWAEQTENAWAVVKNNFAALRDLHVAAAEHNEAMLVVVD